MSSLLLLGAGTDASAGGGGGAVTFDAKSAAIVTGASVTTVTDTGLTIGGGANGLIAILQLQGGVAGTTPVSGLGVTWNSVALTEIGHFLDSGNNAELVFFGLLSPATGNHSLVATWTGSQNAYLCGLSASGLNSTFASAFKNSIGATGSSTTPSVTVTSATGHLPVAQFATNTGSITAWSGTAIGSSTALTANFGAEYQSGAASSVMSATNNVSATWSAFGVDLSS